MKKFLIKIALLFVILAIGDMAIGLGMKYVYENVKSGGQRRNNFIVNELDADIVIFGSSRALHHYNSRLIEDSLGMTCYNCGQDGNGILLDYGRLLLMGKRYTPKYVVVDITPGYDLTKSKNGFDMGWLRPYFDEKGIQALFSDVDAKEKYKMLSSAYRYNSFFIMRLASFLSGRVDKDENNGFAPLRPRTGHMRVDQSELPPVEYDSLKLDYLEKFINLSAGSRLLFVVSPVWQDRKARIEEEIKPLKAMCLQKGIPLIDFTNHPSYLYNDSLFNDGSHLNSKGADEFSRAIVQILRKESE